jgi:hypothetical protein
MNFHEYDAIYYKFRFVRTYFVYHKLLRLCDRQLRGGILYAADRYWTPDHWRRTWIGNKPWIYDIMI